MFWEENQKKTCKQSGETILKIKEISQKVQNTKTVLFCDNIILINSKIHQMTPIDRQSHKKRVAKTNTKKY